MASKKILVTGVTGNQGGAVVRALIANPPPFDYKILAVTRNIRSAKAQALAAANERVELLEGDLNVPSMLFQNAGGVGAVWAVFSIQVPEMRKAGPENREQKQGCNLIDAAIKYEVSHFVYSSVDRGGDASEFNATDVAHFVTKYEIEKHLIQQTRRTNMTYTILRPVAFMENLRPNQFGRTFATMWAGIGDKKLQLVSVKDIGVFAAQAFATPETDEYKNQAVSLAGDELTQKEANEVFWNVMGRPMPMSYEFLAALLQTMLPEIKTMFNWFKNVGYKADIHHCKMLNTGMLDLGTYLKEESGFKR